jgi:hypothetical protein
VREQDGRVEDPGYSMSRAAVSWIAAIVMVYATLFGSGKLLLGHPVLGAGLLVVALAALAVLWMSLQSAPQSAAAPSAVAPLAAGEAS